MSEVRTTSATGGEKGVKPQRHDLLPKTALDVASEVYAFGAEKYADHNWRRKYEWSKSYAAAQRHLTAWWDCQDEDPESGLSHLGHAMFHLFAMATWEREDGSGIDNVYDDRWKHSLARADAAAAESAAEEEERILAEQDMLDSRLWDDAIWATRDLGPIQSIIDQQVRALGYMTDNAGIFSVEAGLEDPLDGLRDALGKPRTLEVEWRTPAVPKAETLWQAIRAAKAILPARFTCGEYGIEDTHHPLTDEQNEAAEQGMIRIAELDGREIWAHRDALERPVATYSIDLPARVVPSEPLFTLPEGYRPALSEADSAARVYLHHWINAHD